MTNQSNESGAASAAPDGEPRETPRDAEPAADRTEPAAPRIFDPTAVKVTNEPRPFPKQTFVRPGIDDRPDLDKALSDEDKSAVARLAVRQRPRPARSAATRPEVQTTVMEASAPVGGAEGPVPDLESAFLDLRDPMVDADGVRPSATDVLRMKLGYTLVAFFLSFALAALNLVVLPERLNAFAGAVGGGISLAWTIGIGLAVSLVATIFFLPMSDHTRTPFGRRSPWFAGGAALAALFGFALSACHTVPALTIVWSFMQIGLAAMLCSMYAALGERVPDKFREATGTWRLFGITAGILAGTVFAWLMMDHVGLAMDLCAGAILVAGACGLLVVPRERSSVYTRIRPMTNEDLLITLRAPRAGRLWYLVCLVRLLASAGTALAITFVWYVVCYHHGVDDPNPLLNTLVTIALMAFAACAVALLSAWVLSLVRARRDDDGALLLIGSSLTIVAVLVPVAVRTGVGLLVFAALGGFAVHMVDDVLQTVAVETIPDVRDAAGYLAVFNTSTNLGRLLGVAVGGVVIAVTREYTSVFEWCALVFALAELAAIVSAVVMAKTRARDAR